MVLVVPIFVICHNSPIVPQIQAIVCDVLRALQTTVCVGPRKQKVVVHIVESCRVQTYQAV